MTNSKREYNEFIRANLPYGITYDSARYQYVTFNGKRFVTYLEAKWYIDYLTKFGGGPEDDIRNDLFGTSEEGVWFEANDSTTLFTDVVGTTPVTTPGDAVALQLDKSQGLTLGPDTVDFAVLGDQGTGWVKEDGIIKKISDDATLYDFGASVEAGKYYEITLTKLNHTLGNPSITVGGNSYSGIISSTEPDGTYTFILQATSSGTVTVAASAARIWLSAFSVKELPGNHRTQATVAARPLYALHPVGGVRNLLEYTEDYSEWFSNAVGGEEFDAIAPDGTSTALKVTFGASANEIFAPPVTSITGQTVLGFFARADSARPLNISATVGGAATTAYFGSANLTSNWQFFEFPKDSGADEITQIRFQNTGTTEERTVPVYVWHPQVEQSSTATNYQRVGSFLDVSEEGKARRGRLWYNGTSHFMQTPTITPGTDKVQVFAGVRNNNTTASAVVELSQSAAINNGVFIVAARESLANYFFASKGTTSGEARTGATFPVPTTNILTALGDISGDSAILRIDGVQEAINTGDQGTGNYLAYPLYFGARGGTTLFYNGYEDTSIIRFGPNLDDTTISKVESYVASKTPASELLIPAGPELVTNGTFDTDTDWTLGAGWTISGGTLSLDTSVSGAGVVTAAQQTVSTVTGNRYQVKFDVTEPTNFSGNEWFLFLGSVNLTSGEAPVVGSYEFNVTALDDDAAILTRTSGTVEGNEIVSLDNISVRQFIPK